MIPQLFSTDQPVPSQVTRLVVLVPLMDLNTLSLSKKITDLAGDRIRQVVYLAVPQNLDEEMILVGKLNHLYAATHSDYIHVETQMQYGSSWRKALRGLLRPGDEVICPEEDIVRWHVLWHKPLSEILMGAIHAHLYRMPYNHHGASHKPGVEINGRFVLMEGNSNGRKKKDSQ